MKINFVETDGCFSIDLQAESQTEAAALVRFGMNRTDKMNYAATNVYQDGKVMSGLVFAKSKRANNDVPKRK